MDPDVGLIRGVVYSIKDFTPRDGISEVDFEVSLSCVKSVIQPVDFSMEADILEDSFSEAFDLTVKDCDKKTPLISSSNPNKFAPLIEACGLELRESSRLA